MDRLGLQPDQLLDQCLKVNVESGETLRDTIAQYWRQVHRQYTDQYPGHERVAAWLSEKDRSFNERFVDNDPNPDLRLKRRENLGEFPRVVQTNVMRVLPAKQEALREMVSRIVNDPAHRHGVAEAVLQAAAAALVYDELLRHLEALKAELARYIELLRQARTHFARAEAMSVNLPVRVVGEVLFNPGFPTTDESGEEVYQGGDIDERYQAY